MYSDVVRYQISDWFSSWFATVGHETTHVGCPVCMDKNCIWREPWPRHQYAQYPGSMNSMEQLKSPMRWFSDLIYKRLDLKPNTYDKGCLIYTKARKHDHQSPSSTIINHHPHSSTINHQHLPSYTRCSWHFDSPLCSNLGTKVICSATRWTSPRTPGRRPGS